jgi:hypothetical protein
MESAMKTLEYLLLAAALAVAGCGSDASTPKPDAAVSPDGGGNTPDGGGMTNPDGGMTAPDGGMTPDGGTAKTLAEFVIDLVKNKTSNTGTPETIDDKTLTDTMDPAAFDGLF